MSFREKSAWISVVTIILIWGYYSSRALPALLAGGADLGGFAGLFIRCTILSVIVQVALTVVIAVLAPRDANAPADERERLFEFKSSRIAYLILSVLVAAAALATPILAGASPHLFPADPLGSALLVMGNAILFSLMFAELVRAGMLIFHYRRAA